MGITLNFYNNEELIYSITSENGNPPIPNIEDLVILNNEQYAVADREYIYENSASVIINIDVEEVGLSEEEDEYSDDESERL